MVLFSLWKMFKPAHVITASRLECCRGHHPVQSSSRLGLQLPASVAAEDRVTHQVRQQLIASRLVLLQHQWCGGPEQYRVLPHQHVHPAQSRHDAAGVAGTDAVVECGVLWAQSLSGGGRWVAGCLWLGILHHWGSAVSCLLCCMARWCTLWTLVVVVVADGVFFSSLFSPSSFLFGIATVEMVLWPNFVNFSSCTALLSEFAEFWFCCTFCVLVSWVCFCFSVILSSL